MHQKSGPSTTTGSRALNQPPLLVVACNFGARPVLTLFEPQPQIVLRALSSIVSIILTAEAGVLQAGSEFAEWRFSEQRSLNQGIDAPGESSV